VTLQLEGINDSERIKDIDDIRQALASLPSTLSKSYEAIYRRIRSMGSRARTVATQTFQWLLCAKRMLSVPEFIVAVGRSGCPSNISSRSILDYCCNLVVMDNETNSFRLAHSTVRE
jgi:hypothetical protein